MRCSLVQADFLAACGYYAESLATTLIARAACAIMLTCRAAPAACLFSRLTQSRKVE
jgi:hypothetical protein